MNLEKYIVNIPNFPKPGIQFKDITNIFKNRDAFHYVVNQFVNFARKLEIEVIVAPEARGYWFAPVVAYQLNIAFVPIRKRGKLPRATYNQEYNLEYNVDFLEIHQDALQKNQRVLLLDDVLATSGTIIACSQLVKKAGGIVIGYGFIGEILALKGRIKLGSVDYISLLQF